MSNNTTNLQQSPAGLLQFCHTVLHESACLQLEVKSLKQSLAYKDALLHKRTAENNLLKQVNNELRADANP